jgi:site-specific recombinase XerD
MDIYALQDLMGHADLQVLKRYLKITNDDIRTEHKKVSPVDNNL